MLNPDDKTLGLIIGGKGDEGEKPEDGPPDEFVAAAEDILDAVKGGKASMLAEALHNFFTMCDSGPHEEGPPE